MRPDLDLWSVLLEGAAPKAQPRGPQGWLHGLRNDLLGAAFDRRGCGLCGWCRLDLRAAGLRGARDLRCGRRWPGHWVVAAVGIAVLVAFTVDVAVT